MERLVPFLVTKSAKIVSAYLNLIGLDLALESIVMLHVVNLPARQLISIVIPPRNRAPRTEPAAHDCGSAGRSVMTSVEESVGTSGAWINAF